MLLMMLNDFGSLCTAGCRGGAVVQETPKTHRLLCDTNTSYLI